MIATGAAAPASDGSGGSRERKDRNISIKKPPSGDPIVACGRLAPQRRDKSRRVFFTLPQGVVRVLSAERGKAYAVRNARSERERQGESYF